MIAPRAQSTTTEEHRLPSSTDVVDGRPVLLGAFPVQVAISLPSPGEVVGRAWLSNAGVQDTEISGRHLRFLHADGRAYIEDVGSRNGTWLDGVRIPSRERTLLGDGAVLRLGRTLLVYRAAFDGALGPAPPLGRLVGPWGLCTVRARIAALSERPERNVLIEGATGAGKELVAAAVIQALGRAKKPYVSLNVAAVAAGVFEAQLFGWVKGAYSGSADGGDGIFRKSDGGSVFLDEIGELPLDLQAKLLRVLENQEILPVGASKHVPVDVAVVAATNRALEDAVERGAFRRDLHARFTVRLSVPPLADRPEDLYAILVTLADRRKLTIDASLSDVEAVERLMLAAWPANVRDLDRVTAALAPALARSRTLKLAAVEAALGTRVQRGELTREEAERMVRECDGNERAAERRFGVPRGKLRRALGKAGRGERAT